MDTHLQKRKLAIISIQFLRFSLLTCVAFVGNVKNTNTFFRFRGFILFITVNRDYKNNCLNFIFTIIIPKNISLQISQNQVGITNRLLSSSKLSRIVDSRFSLILGVSPTENRADLSNPARDVSN